MAFGYYAASVILPTRWHFRVLLRGTVVSEFPSSRTDDVSRSPSLPAIRRVYQEQRLDVVANVSTPHHAILAQVYQPLSPVAVHGPLAQVPLVSIGNRSGRSTCLWLRVAELLSLGFPPSRVPLVNAGQVDLTPLSMCSSLCEQSIRHVKWRGAASGGAFRDKNQDKT